MKEKCICKGGKTNNKCPMHGSKVNLDSFHKLNPEARPKTAAQFKIAMDPRLAAGLGLARQSLVPAAAMALPAAALAGATADKGEGVGDAVKGGLMAGAGTLGAAMGHNYLMGANKGYRSGVGGQIQDVVNKGRQFVGGKLGIPKMAADKFKIKLAAPDPAYYGQYGQDDDSGTSGINKALLLGGGAALAGGAHHMAMNSRSDLARKYQTSLGGGIRDAANSARERFGIPTVAQPPHPIIGKIQDAMGGIGENLGRGVETAKKVAPVAMEGAGAAMGAKALHDKYMQEGSNGSEMYKNLLGRHLETAGSKLKDMGGQAASWIAKKTAPAPAAPTGGPMPSAEQTFHPSSLNEAAMVHPSISGAKPGLGASLRSKLPFMKRGSMIYDAGAEAAYAAYLF